MPTTAERWSLADQQGRIVTNLYDPGLQVHTAWDLGIGDHTVIWMYQQDAQAIRLIDYYAAAGYGFDHYAEVLQSKRYRGGSTTCPMMSRLKSWGLERAELKAYPHLASQLPWCASCPSRMALMQ